MDSSFTALDGSSQNRKTEKLGLPVELGVRVSAVMIPSFFVCTLTLPVCTTLNCLGCKNLKGLLSLECLFQLCHGGGWMEGCTKYL